MQGGEIQIVSDDPENPILVQPLVGTGLLSASPIDYRDIAVDYGNDFVMVGTGSDAYKGDNIFTFRTKSDSEGNWSFFYLRKHVLPLSSLTRLVDLEINIRIRALPAENPPRSGYILVSEPALNQTAMGTTYLTI